jgi:hypothetical protein
MKHSVRWLVRLVVSIFVTVMLLLAARAIADSWAQSRLDRQFAALHAVGEPVTLEELAKVTIPAEDNAATYLVDAGPHVAAIMRALSAPFDLAECELDDRQLPYELRRMIRGVFEAHPQAIDLLNRASNCPDFDPLWDPAAGPFGVFEDAINVTQVRDAARLVRIVAMTHLADGNPDDALVPALMWMRICRLMQRKCLVVGFHVSIALRDVAIRSAVDVLASDNLSQRSRAALDAELQRHDDVGAFRHALLTERVVGLATYEEMRAHLITPRTLAWWVPSIWTNDQCRYLDGVAAVLERTHLPYLERPRVQVASDDADNESTLDMLSLSPDSLLPLSQTFLPALSISINVVDRSAAKLRSLLVLNSVRRYEIAHGGGAPQLSQLELPEEATTDPFNGQPLRLKSLPDGYVVYAVGRNLTDDGGDVTGLTEKDVGLRLVRPAGPEPPPKCP